MAINEKLKITNETLIDFVFNEKFYTSGVKYTHPILSCNLLYSIAHFRCHTRVSRLFLNVELRFRERWLLL